LIQRLPVLALVLLAAPAASALDVEQLDGETLAELTRDGPLVAIDEADDGGLELATAITVIDAPPQAVWDTLVDFDSYPQWMPQTTGCEVVAHQGAERLVTTTLEFDLVITKRVEYTLSYRDQGSYRMEFDHVSGDLARNEGYWVVRPFRDDRSILYYANYVDYTSIKLLRSFLKRQPTLELAFGASSVAVIVRSVKQRVENP